MHATWSLVSALYHPTECQVLTLALDAQLCYWEVIDGKEIRHLVLGKHSSVTALDVSHDGESFMTATDSSLIKVYLIPSSNLIFWFTKPNFLKQIVKNLASALFEHFCILALEVQARQLVCNGQSS